MIDLDKKIEKNLALVRAGIRYQVARTKTTTFINRTILSFYLSFVASIVGLIIEFRSLFMAGFSLCLIYIIVLFFLIIKEERLKYKWMNLTSKK